jgi:hypothetical protein
LGAAADIPPGAVPTLVVKMRYASPNVTGITASPAKRFFMMMIALMLFS